MNLESQFYGKRCNLLFINVFGIIIKTEGMRRFSSSDWKLMSFGNKGSNNGNGLRAKGKYIKGLCFVLTPPDP